MWKLTLVWFAVAAFKDTHAQHSPYSHRPYIGRAPSRTSSNSGTSAQKVKLEVFYETNCPDSVRFITKQLYPVYIEMKDVIDIHLIPFGKASETYDSVSKKYVFKCQHGPAECYGNTVQSCVISLYPKTEDHLNFIYCMQSYPRPSDNGDKCARRLSMDWNKISKCANGDEGNRLMHEKAGLTNALNPLLNFVPWINVNNVHTNNLQRRSLQDLKEVVCDSYEGKHSRC